MKILSAFCNYTVYVARRTVRSTTARRTGVAAVFGAAVIGFASTSAASDPPAPSPSPSPAGKIDPIEANDPEFSAKFGALYEQTWGPGVIPEKYKQLTGVSISVVERCDTCLGWHIKQAVRLGANKAELVEAIRLGQLTGGSISIPTVRKAYELISDLKLKQTNE